MAWNTEHGNTETIPFFMNVTIRFVYVPFSMIPCRFRSDRIRGIWDCVPYTRIVRAG